MARTGRPTAQITLTDEELAVIDGLVPPGNMVSPFYQADWGPHLYR